VSQIFSSLGGVLSSVFKTLGGGNLGGGLTRGAGIGLAIPSLISQMQQAGQQDQYLQTMLNLNKQYQQQEGQYYNTENQALQRIVNTTPTQAGQQINAMTQPLNSQLVSSVSNPVQAYLAERGLSEAPGIQAQTLATALAPFEQQNQQTAAQTWLGMNQLPFYAPQPGTPPGVNFPQTAGFGGLASLLMGQPKPPQSPMYPNPFPPGSYGTPQPNSPLMQQQSSPGPGGLVDPSYYMDPGTAQPPWMAALA
jgi:hypothetical protein